VNVTAILLLLTEVVTDTSLKPINTITIIISHIQHNNYFSLFNTIIDSYLLFKLCTY